MLPTSLSTIFFVLICCGLVGSLQGPQSTLHALDDAPVMHFTLERRGGTFEATRPGNDSVEMDVLLEELQKIEARFNLTRREVRGNKLVRKAKSHAVGGKDDEDLMGELALNGTWWAHLKHRSYFPLSFNTNTTRFARLTLGEPPQTIDLDLNMLTSDFYIRHTSSHAGTKYDDLFSKSFGKQREKVVFAWPAYLLTMSLQQNLGSIHIEAVHYPRRSSISHPLANHLLCLFLTAGHSGQRKRLWNPLAACSA